MMMIKQNKGSAMVSALIASVLIFTGLNMTIGKMDRFKNSQKQIASAQSQERMFQKIIATLGNNKACKSTLSGVPKPSASGSSTHSPITSLKDADNKEILKAVPGKSLKSGEYGLKEIKVILDRADFRNSHTRGTGSTEVQKFVTTLEITLNYNLTDGTIEKVVKRFPDTKPLEANPEDPGHNQGIFLHFGTGGLEGCSTSVPAINSTVCKKTTGITKVCCRYIHRFSTLERTEYKTTAQPKKEPKLPNASGACGGENADLIKLSTDPNCSKITESCQGRKNIGYLEATCTDTGWEYRTRCVDRVPP